MHGEVMKLGSYLSLKYLGNSSSFFQLLYIYLLEVFSLQIVLISTTSQNAFFI